MRLFAFAWLLRLLTLAWLLRLLSRAGLLRLLALARLLRLLSLAGLLKMFILAWLSWLLALARLSRLFVLAWLSSGTSVGMMSDTAVSVGFPFVSGSLVHNTLRSLTRDRSCGDGHGNQGGECENDRGDLHVQENGLWCDGVFEFRDGIEVVVVDRENVGGNGGISLGLYTRATREGKDPYFYQGPKNLMLYQGSNLVGWTQPCSDFPDAT